MDRIKKFILSILICIMVLPLLVINLAFMFVGMLIFPLVALFKPENVKVKWGGFKKRRK